MKEQTGIREKLRATALDAPKTPGVYLWKDEAGGVIYVGKAKSLKNRLSSYFASNRDIKTRILVSRAHSIEYIQCDNEYEALLLENTLIKRYSPRYNINLKDGKTYPVIRISAEPFPRIYRTRTIKNDGARYFGPYPNVTALDQFLEFVKRSYRFRQCRVLKKRTAPCLYYHIGRCLAPCCGKVSEEEYRRELDEIVLLLSGNDGSADDGPAPATLTEVDSAPAGESKPSTEAVDSLARLTAMMKEAAKELRFEKAARIRDGIRAIAELTERNAVVDMDPEARDYVAWAAEGTMVSFAVLQMRSGRLVGRDLYRARSLKDEEEILPEFLMAYYTKADRVPPRIFVPTVNGLALAERWFADSLGIKTRIEVIETVDAAKVSGEASDAVGDATEKRTDGALEAASGPEESYGNAESGDLATDRRHQAAMAMARFNAREDAKRRLREHGDFPALEELKSTLSLPRLPSRIEGFDIAHIGGRLPVASLISFRDGNPDRKNYRMFRLRTTDGVIDDFASMREVTSRRYSRLMNEGTELPDLILIDGGIGQVNAVKGVLDALGADVPIVGLAKEDEELYLPGNSTPIRLPKRSDALRLLQRVRDETHRFATTRNQRLRTKENTTLIFERLPGIGPRKATALLDRFGSLEALAEAVAREGGIEELAQAARVSAEAAEVVARAVPALLAEREAERTARAGGAAGGQGKSLSAGDIARLAREAGGGD
jgi:excinuclease ABC subunit C